MITDEGQFLRRNCRLGSESLTMREIRTETPVKNNSLIDPECDPETSYLNTVKDMDKEGLQYSQAGRVLKQQTDQNTLL